MYKIPDVNYIKFLDFCLFLLLYTTTTYTICMCFPVLHRIKTISNIGTMMCYFE
jgi:hypothetical protein